MNYYGWFEPLLLAPWLLDFYCKEIFIFAKCTYLIFWPGNVPCLFLRSDFDHQSRVALNVFVKMAYLHVSSVIAVRLFQFIVRRGAQFYFPFCLFGERKIAIFILFSNTFEFRISMQDSHGERYLDVCQTEPKIVWNVSNELAAGIEDICGLLIGAHSPNCVTKTMRKRIFVKFHGKLFHWTAHLVGRRTIFWHASRFGHFRCLVIWTLLRECVLVCNQNNNFNGTNGTIKKYRVWQHSIAWAWHLKYFLLSIYVSCDVRLRFANWHRDAQHAVHDCRL